MGRFVIRWSYGIFAMLLAALTIVPLWLLGILAQVVAHVLIGIGRSWIWLSSGFFWTMDKWSRWLDSVLPEPFE